MAEPQKTAKPEPQQPPQRQAPQLRDEDKTHLLVRSRPAKFRRAGLYFTNEYQALKLADLSPDQIRALVTEPMLDTQAVHEHEVERYVAAKAAAASGDLSPAQMVQELVRQATTIDRQNERIAALEAKLSGLDSPPTRSGDLPGMPPVR